VSNIYKVDEIQANCVIECMSINDIYHVDEKAAKRALM